MANNLNIALETIPLQLFNGISDLPTRDDSKFRRDRSCLIVIV